MKLLSSFCILLLVLFNLQAFAQKEELEDIDVEMLLEESSPIDEDASSEILYEKGEVRFNLRRIVSNELRVTRRIKIYKSDAYDEADIEIYFYKGSSASSSETIRKLKAATYILENGEVKEIKLDKDAIFETNVSENLYVQKFTFPNLQEGAILEYSYILNSPYLQSLRPWSFQSNKPTRYSECDVLIPSENIIYSVQQRGYHKIQQLSESKYNSSGRRVYVAKHIPAMEAENHVANISNYLTSIHFEIAQVSFGSEVKNYATNWNDVYNRFRNSNTFKKELNRSNYFEDDLDEILADPKLKTDDDKITAIYQFVQKKFDWNKQNSKYVSDNLKKVYKEERGNSADINITLTAMLNAAGLSAYPVYTSTISNGIPLFPTVTGYNNIISCVRDSDKNLILLDATDKFLLAGQISSYALNWSGIILTDYSNKFISLTDKETSNQICTVLANIEEDGSINGQARVNYSSHFATKMRNKTENIEESYKIKLYRELFNIEQIEDFKQSNFYEVDKPLSHSFSFSDVSGYAEQISDKFYLSPLLFLATKEHPFKLKERNYPIDYIFPRKYKNRIIYNLPEGYEVESLPKQEIYKVGEDYYALVYQISQRGNKIFVEVDFSINKSSVPAEYYEDVRQFYTGLLDKEEEHIVLKKS